MIYLTKQQLCDRYGATTVCLNRRFNADDSSSHTNAAYQYEFGYLQGRCIYAIIQKTQGSNIALVEAASLLAINGPGTWTRISPPDAPTMGDVLNNPVNNLGFSYAPDAHDAFHPSALFASHQLNRRQLIVYHPLWQVDLSQVESDPLI